MNAHVNRTPPNFIGRRIKNPHQRTTASEQYNPFAYAAWVRRVSAASVGAALGTSLAALTATIIQDGNKGRIFSPRPSITAPIGQENSAQIQPALARAQVVKSTP